MNPLKTTRKLWHSFMFLLALLLLLGAATGIATASNGDIFIGSTIAHTSHLAGPFATTNGNIHIGGAQTPIATTEGDIRIGSAQAPIAASVGDVHIGSAQSQIAASTGDVHVGNGG